jgi:ribosomal silencing factor RsfS
MQELINAVVDAAQDKKAQNPVILDIRDISFVTD